MQTLRPLLSRCTPHSTSGTSTVHLALMTGGWPTFNGLCRDACLRCLLTQDSQKAYATGLLDRRGLLEILAGRPILSGV